MEIFSSDAHLLGQLLRIVDPASAPLPLEHLTKRINHVRPLATATRENPAYIEQLQSPVFRDRCEIYLAFLLCGITYDRVDVCEWLVNKENVHPSYMGYRYLDASFTSRRFLIQVCAVRGATHCYIWFRKRFPMEAPMRERVSLMIKPAPQLWAIERCEHYLLMGWIKEQSLPSLLAMVHEWKIQAGECGSLLQSIYWFATFVVRLRCSGSNQDDDDIDDVLNFLAFQTQNLPHEADCFGELLKLRLRHLVRHPSVWAWLEARSRDEERNSLLLLQLLADHPPEMTAALIDAGIQQKQKHKNLSRLALYATTAVFHNNRTYYETMCKALLPYVELPVLLDCIEWFDLLFLTPKHRIQPSKVAWMARTGWKAPSLSRNNKGKLAAFESNCRGEYKRRLLEEAQLETLIGELLQLPGRETSVITSWIIAYI